MDWSTKMGKQSLQLVKDVIGIEKFAQQTTTTTNQVSTNGNKFSHFEESVKTIQEVQNKQNI